MNTRFVSKCAVIVMGLALGGFSSLALAKTPWGDLSPKQQELLEPVRPKWGSMNPNQQNRLIKISERYEKQDPSKQAVMRERILEWSELSPKERAEARRNYKLLSEESSKRGERNLNWNGYQTRQMQQGAPHQTSSAQLAPPDQTTVPARQ